MTRRGDTPLAQRRQVLVATATLQRARLAQEWQALRATVRPGPLGIAAAAAGLAAITLRARASAARSARPRAVIDAPLWASAALTLWRAARAWLQQRQRAADAPPH
jgi:hypothetical protein